MQFAKNLIEGFWKLWYAKELLCKKKVPLESYNHNSQITPNKFLHNFYQPIVNSIDTYNANFKKLQESAANQINSQGNSENQNLDIKGIIDLRKLYTNNLIISYLNINSLRNKITKLRKIFKKATIDLLCIEKIELDASFPVAQLHIEGYQYSPFRWVHNKNGEGKMIFIGEGLVAEILYA